jgi:hypothetical protein
VFAVGTVMSGARLAGAMTGVLHKRGVTEPTAILAAGRGIRAFHRAFEQGADPTNQQTFIELTRHAVEGLRAARATLD